MKASLIFQLVSLFLEINSFCYAQLRMNPVVPNFSAPPSTVFQKIPQLAQTVYGGTGCPEGSASVTFSPDSSAITILFDQFSVQTQGAHEVSVKDCTLVIPIHVPKGMSARVVRVDYRGYRFLPQKARLDITANHALSDWASGNFLSHLHTYQNAAGGLKDGDFTFSADAVNSPSDIVPCGKPFNLHIKSQLNLNSQAAHEAALATLDSADATANGSVVYRLAWKQCGLL